MPPQFLKLEAPMSSHVLCAWALSTSARDGALKHCSHFAARGRAALVCWERESTPQGGKVSRDKNSAQWKRSTDTEYSMATWFVEKVNSIENRYYRCQDKIAQMRRYNVLTFLSPRTDAKDKQVESSFLAASPKYLIRIQIFHEIPGG